MKLNRLVIGAALLLLTPLQQESTGFLGIDWWVWIVIGVILLLVLLIIGYVLQGEPGPPIPQRESKMYVTAGSVGKAQAVAETKQKSQPETEPETQPISKSASEPEPEKEIPLKPQPKPENLSRIEGVGPKVVTLLNEAGITTFAALAETDVERLNQILDEAELQFMDPSSWPQQAALAARGDWKAFEKLTAELKGGRRES